MTTTILIAIAAFLAITLVLVALLLYAKAKLTSSGDVVIDINGGEKVITTESGSTPLSTLANNKVFLPSACGGGGSCGMCKCPGARRRRRHSAHRDGLHLAQAGQGPLASRLPGEGQGEYENPCSRGRAGRQEVGVHRGLEPQYLDFPQGVRREAARRREPQVPAAAVTSRSTFRSTTPSSSRRWTWTRSSAPTGTNSRCGIW